MNFGWDEANQRAFVNAPVQSPITFTHGGVNERMRITTIGRVGIGTTNPSHVLDVVGNINTSTQYLIGGLVVLNTSGTQNTFAGVLAGANGGGTNGSFFGFQAGKANITGNNNSFFGTFAGATNQDGANNSFFGEGAGAANIAGDSNAFFGFHAGVSNVAGNNSFFGFDAGASNTTLGANSYFGFEAGKSGTGDSNSFFGRSTGASNTTGNHNSFFGAFADSADGLANASAIGFRAFVAQSNSLVLGGINGVNGASADTRVGIGTTTPAKHLHIFGAGDQEIGIESSDSGGRQWTLQSSRGASPFSGEFQIIDRTANASRFSILGNGNVGLGTTAPATALHVVGGANGVAFAENHLVLIENTSPSFGIGTSTLAIKLTQRNNPDSQDNFITFIKGSGESAGSVEGNGSGGISFGGIGNDYAEWLPRLNSAEKIQPGEIVGLYGGHITKNTRGAAQVMAVSTGAIVAGNDPGTDARGKYALVAFIGQVMTRVRGSVQAGDFIVASGLNDGTGIAVSPERITAEQFEQVAGQAWETSADTNVKSVRIAVGLIRRDPTVRRLLQYSRDQGDRIDALDARLATVEAQLTSKTARSSPRPVTKKKHRLVAQLTDAGPATSAQPQAH
jgi:hypothetical protein